MFKKLLRLIFLFIIAIVILVIIFGLFVLYLTGQTGKVRNGESYCINKQYAIGKAFNENKVYFCDNNKKGKCIEGEIKGNFIDESKSLYLFFELNDFSGKNEQEINEMVKVDNPKGYIYSLFSNDYENKYYAKNYNEVISFLKLDYNTCKLTFYTNGDINKLDNEEKNIFQKLVNK